MFHIDPVTRKLIHLALREDVGAGDLTTRNFLPASARVRARVIAKQAGVYCGGPVAAAVFRALSPRCRVRLAAPEGSRVKAGRTVLEVSGGPAVLSAERVALNFLQRLSGVATLTRRYADALRGTGVKVYDTRKTTPGWRALEKYAVLCGGGANHRMGLFDAVMIKDNHLKTISGQRSAVSGLKAYVAAFRRKHPRVELEMEADTLSQVRDALALGADAILLDNMPIATLKNAISLIRTLPLWREGRQRGRRCLVEISGGVTLENIRSLARLAPDRISVGRLTHSAPALDLSLDIDA